jgi:hypothetical protein
MAADTVSDSPPHELCRQACEEIRQRLRAGQPCQAETILSAHPSLSTDPELAVEVILAEFLVRKELGQGPNPLDWLDRFPQYRGPLASAFESHQLLSGTPAAGVSTGVSTAAFGDTQEAIDLDGPVPALEQHEKLEELGHGAMGVVFRARDKVLDRVVALKTIKAGLLAGPDEVRRFYREARAAARLHHPHIVPIHHMGLFEGQHSYTMRLLAGGNLARRLDEYRDDFRAAAALLENVARAVHAAHGAGVIHRDLKPANILLDENGEPLVGDFGLAKLEGGRPDASLPGQRLGTPAYMSPEQARGHTWEVSPRSDVWALGVILYELLTGRRPFQGDDAEGVIRQLLTTDPPLLRQTRPEVPRDLETVVLKCLEKQPDQRYQSAEALANDLRRWLEEKPLTALPLAWPRRIGRAIRRRVGWRSAAALLFVVLLAGGGFLAFRHGALFGPSPEGPALSPYERAQTEIRNELAAGRSVVLVDSDRVVRSSRWATEKDRSPFSFMPGLPLSLDSWGMTLLELVHDPGVERYTLSTEIQFDNNLLKGQVGLYFLADEVLVEGRPRHRFCCLQLAGQPVSKTAPQTGLARLRFFHCSEVAGDQGPIELALQVGSEPIPWPELTKWHTLTVDVTPDDLVAHCDQILVATLTRNRQDKLVRPWEAGMKQPPPPAEPPSFPRRGSIGLFAHKGQAHYRNTVIRPLP